MFLAHVLPALFLVAILRWGSVLGIGLFGSDVPLV